MPKLYTVVISEAEHIFKQPVKSKEIERYEHQNITQVKRHIGNFVLSHSNCSTVRECKSFEIFITTIPKLGNYVGTNLTVTKEES